MKPRILAIDERPPISVAECRRHLEYPGTGEPDEDEAEDAAILEKLAAARATAEDFLGLSLTPRRLEVALDSFPCYRREGRAWIELEGGPVYEVLSVRAGEGTSDSGAPSDGELAATAWILDDFSQPARLHPAPPGWPPMTPGVNALRIVYLAGYDFDSDNNSLMPKQVKQALLLLLGDYWANREDSTEKPLSPMPNGVESLLRPLREKLGFA